jgi:flavorubredoxin
MNALVVYDTTFSNTEHATRAIGADLGGDTVESPSIAEVRQIAEDLEPLMIGGPTQGHRVAAPLKVFLDGSRRRRRWVFPPPTAPATRCRR